MSFFAFARDNEIASLNVASHHAPNVTLVTRSLVWISVHFSVEWITYQYFRELFDVY